MPAITEANYPAEDGWNHVEVTLKEGETSTTEEWEQMAVFFIGGFNAQPSDYDIFTAPQDGRILKAAVRLKAA
ncbi:MAG: hypothetical protein K9N47_05715 [Prosthecobacter sp.]|uniref:hypothetical protein n=1 Tax=Prosthecobacter sp. TaxID=1965333 RepID=UPI0025D58DE7|nr:hypothetical protein [Prosthecobacter sp.]MCF7785598.1 hypothetical protein [Prosthecobacter sp.]